MPKQFYNHCNVVINEVIAGLVSSMLMIIMAILVSAIIFSGPLVNYFSLGLTATLFGSTLLNLFTAMWGSLKYGISRIEPAIGAVVAAIFFHLSQHHLPGPILESTLLACFMVISFAAGLAMFLFGYFNLSQASRFLPYPVLGGIITGIAWVMAKSSYFLMPIAPTSLMAFFYGEGFIKWLIAILLVFILYFFSKNNQRLWLMPLLIVIFTFSINLYLFINHTSYADAVKLGWLFPQINHVEINYSLNIISVIKLADWSIIFSQIGYIGILVTIIIIIQMLNISSLELFAEKKLNAERDFKVCGIGNIINSFFCGFPGNVSLTGTILNNHIGGKTRLSGVLTSLFSLSIIFIIPELYSYIPKPVVVGLLLFIAIKLLLEWLYEGFQKLPFEDYLIILFILTTIMAYGLLIGFFIGLLITCLFFIVRYARLDAVRFIATGAEFKSNVTRPVYEQQILTNQAEQIIIFKLQGYIFFGSIKALLDKLLFIAENKKIKFILLDFELVNGIDSSTSYNFIRLRQYTKKLNTILIFTNASKGILRQFYKQKVLGNIKENIQLFTSLDYGLEWCENIILKHIKNIQYHHSIKEMIKYIINDERYIEPLMKYLQKKVLQKDELLFVQHDQQYSLYFLESGEMSVIVYNNKHIIRLSKIGCGSLIGEIGFILKQERTATVIAESKCVIYELSEASFQELEKECPAAVVYLQMGMLNILAQRLVNTNKALQLTYLHNDSGC